MESPKYTLKQKNNKTAIKIGGVEGAVLLLGGALATAAFVFLSSLLKNRRKDGDTEEKIDGGNQRPELNVVDDPSVKEIEVDDGVRVKGVRSEMNGVIIVEEAVTHEVSKEEELDVKKVCCEGNKVEHEQVVNGNKEKEVVEDEVADKKGESDGSISIEDEKEKHGGHVDHVDELVDGVAEKVELKRVSSEDEKEKQAHHNDRVDESVEEEDVEKIGHKHVLNEDEKEKLGGHDHVDEFVVEKMENERVSDEDVKEKHGHEDQSVEEDIAEKMEHKRVSDEVENEKKVHHDHVDEPVADKIESERVLDEDAKVKHGHVDYADESVEEDVAEKIEHKHVSNEDGKEKHGDHDHVDESVTDDIESERVSNKDGKEKLGHEYHVDESVEEDVAEEVERDKRVTNEDEKEKHGHDHDHVDESVAKEIETERASNEDHEEEKHGHEDRVDELVEEVAEKTETEGVFNGHDETEKQSHEDCVDESNKEELNYVENGLSPLLKQHLSCEDEIIVTTEIEQDSTSSPTKLDLETTEVNQNEVKAGVENETSHDQTTGFDNEEGSLQKLDSFEEPLQEVGGKVEEDVVTKEAKKEIIQESYNFKSKYGGKPSKRAVAIAAFSVVSSLSCSWLFDLSLVNLCLVLFLVMALSRKIHAHY